VTLWTNLRRLGHIQAVVARHLLGHVLTARFPGVGRRLGMAPVAGPDRLRQALEELGGTFLKLGQMLALQPDILSLEYCDALFNLMDRVPPFGFSQVEEILREELGAGPDELFDFFDRRPLATASIGQVHVAALGGRKLAVKVRRPNVEIEFWGDIRLMRLGIRLVRLLRLSRLYWLIEPLSELIAWTREELDYRFEARYMERLGVNACQNPAERVPAVCRERSTRRVLTVELLEGVTVLDYLRALRRSEEITLARVRSGGFEANLFARNIIDNFLGDAFKHGIFHADLHPANLMILPGSVVGYVDFGITAVLSPYSRQHLVKLTLAYTRGDLDGMCEAFFKISSFRAGSDPEEFAAGLKRLAADWYGSNGEGRQLRKNFTLVMLDMLNISRSTGILPERDVVKYIRSAIAIDGLISRFAPDFELGRYLETVCDRYLRLAARQALFHESQWIEWIMASSHLLRDGAVRATAALDRFVDSGLSGTGSRPGEVERGSALLLRGLPALRVSAVAFGASSLMVAGHERVELGANLFTAEAFLLALSLTLLGWSLYQIPGGQTRKEPYRA
jgi:ubiquinone biosynthesis protein